MAKFAFNSRQDLASERRCREQLERKAAQSIRIWAMRILESIRDCNIQCIAMCLVHHVILRDSLSGL